MAFLSEQNRQPVDNKCSLSVQNRPPVADKCSEDHNLDSSNKCSEDHNLDSSNKSKMARFPFDFLVSLWAVIMDWLGHGCVSVSIPAASCYVIRSALSDNVMSVSQGSTEDGALVVQSNDATVLYSKWAIERTSGGDFFSIMALHSEQFLSIDKASKKDVVQLQDPAVSGVDEWCFRSA